MSKDKIAKKQDRFKPSSFVEESDDESNQFEKQPAQQQKKDQKIKF